MVTGLNLKTSYDTADVAEPALPDEMMDVRVQNMKRLNYSLSGMSAADARASLETADAQVREREYLNWLHDLKHKQPRLLSQRLLDHPSVASNGIILRDRGQPTLEQCRSAVTAWLRPVVGKGGEIRVRAKKQWNESGNFGKVKNTLPAASFLDDKGWNKLFDLGSEYQTVMAAFQPAGAAYPVAGIVLRYSKGSRIDSLNYEQRSKQFDEIQMARTLGKMRGRTVGNVVQGHTFELSLWVINHDDCFGYLQTSVGDMKQRLDA